MTKCQITCKSLQKSSKCQNFLRVWHLVIFRADQLKKPPCILSAFQLFKKPLCSTFIFFCEIINAQLNAERSAEILFNLLDVDNNGDINEEEFIRS